MEQFLLLVFGCALVSQLVVSAPTTTRQLSNQTCDNTAFLEEIKKTIYDSSPVLLYLGELPAYPAFSCQQILQLRPKAGSGYYWLQEGSGPVKAFCLMEGSRFGQEGAWMGVARVNMTENNSQCPSGLELITSPRRLCRKIGNGGGCSSVIFPAHNILYTRVCGKVIGYQYYSPNAFSPFRSNQGLTIDGLYVDGVSLTYGSNPRQHIWTYAAAIDETPGQSSSSCHCTNDLAFVPFTGVIPPFIGEDYFCETGSRLSYQNQWYLNDPLWDGEGCGRFSSCCDREQQPHKPWFCKELPEPTTDDIELRACRDNPRSSDEDVGLEMVEIYVQ